MKDVSEILLKGLVPALNNAVGLTFYTKVPKYDANGKPLDYPYGRVSDVFINENGPKTSYRYSVETLIQVIYADQTSLDPMLTAKDKVLGLVKHGSPFALADPYQIEECRLTNSTHAELPDGGDRILDVGIVRVEFIISKK